MSPTVSVIMPVYNGERYLKESIESVRRQTLADIEIICVDDGSTDSSGEILRALADQDPRIVLLKQENRGAGAARNAGLRIARGRYLSFLDSDDFFEKDMLEKAVRRIRRDRADFVVFGCDQYLEDKGRFHRIRYSLRAETLPPYLPFHWRDITDNVFRTFVGWAWDKLYDAKFVQRNGLLFQEQRTSNDVLFVFSALVKSRRITVIDEILAHQRRNNSASLSNTRERSWRCFYDALTAIRDMLKEQGIYEELERDYINYALHFCFWNLDSITGPKYPVLYQKLKEEWFPALGVTGRPEEYFYRPDEYLHFRKVQCMGPEEYAAWLKSGEAAPEEGSRPLPSLDRLRAKDTCGVRKRLKNEIGRFAGYNTTRHKLMTDPQAWQELQGSFWADRFRSMKEELAGIPAGDRAAYIAWNAAAFRRAEQLGELQKEAFSEDWSSAQLLIRDPEGYCYRSLFQGGQGLARLKRTPAYLLGNILLCLPRAAKNALDKRRNAAAGAEGRKP